MGDRQEVGDNFAVIPQCLANKVGGGDLLAIAKGRRGRRFRGASELWTVDGSGIGNAIAFHSCRFVLNLTKGDRRQVALGELTAPNDTAAIIDFNLGVKAGGDFHVSIAAADDQLADGLQQLGMDVLVRRDAGGPYHGQNLFGDGIGPTGRVA
ncbi:hypothetical protein D3C81_1217410 [compost metagenome]